MKTIKYLLTLLALGVLLGGCGMGCVTACSNMASAQGLTEKGPEVFERIMTECLKSCGKNNPENGN